MNKAKNSKRPRGYKKKKQKFGMNRLDALPDDLQELIKKHGAASKIQSSNAFNPKKRLEDSLYKSILRKYKDYPDLLVKNLKNPEQRFSAGGDEFSVAWFAKASKVLKKKDFDFVNKNLWWKIIDYQLEDMVDIIKEYPFVTGMPMFEKDVKNVMTILKTAGYEGPTNYSQGKDLLANLKQASKWWKDATKPKSKKKKSAATLKELQDIAVANGISIYKKGTGSRIGTTHEPLTATGLKRKLTTKGVAYFGKKH